MHMYMNSSTTSLCVIFTGNDMKSVLVEINGRALCASDVADRVISSSDE